MNQVQTKETVRTVVFLLILMLVVTLVYSNHFHNAFHFDDTHTIVNNVFIQKTSNIPLFFKDGSTFSSLPTNQSYRPIVSTTLAVDYSLGEGLQDTFYFHLTSYLVFLLQGLMMFFVMKKIFDIAWPSSSNFYAAAFGLAWYMCHPAIAETVNYIIARSDSISTMFVVLAFLMFIKSRISRKFYLYLIPVAIGVLAKPPAVMFAPLLFLYILFFEKNASLFSVFDSRQRKSVFEAFNAALPSFFFCAIMFLFVQKMEPETWTPGGSSRLHYLITQPYVILHYFFTFFFPVRLSADTDWTPLTSMTDPKFLVGSIFILALAVIAVVTSRKLIYRPISFGILWFFLALLPSSSIIPLAEVMNDHRLYFPYVGLMISVIWSLALLIKRWYYRLPEFKTYKPTLITLSLILLGGYAFGTYKRNEVWKTSDSLWKDVTIKSPKNARGLMNYGLSLMAKGNYAEAEGYFLRGLELWPTYSYLHINMGVLKEATGKKAEAEKYFKDAIAYGPQYPNSHFYYGRFLKNQGKLTEAAASLRKSVELSPAHIDARNLLMDVLFEQNEFEALKAEAEKALAINPSDEKALIYRDAGAGKKSRLELEQERVMKNPTADNYLNLSMEFYKAAKYQESIDAAQNALELNPQSAEAYNNIAAAYGALGDWKKEIEMCEKALAIKPDLQIAKNNMAWAKSQLEKQNQSNQ